MKLKGVALEGVRKVKWQFIVVDEARGCEGQERRRRERAKKNDAVNRT